LIHHVLVRVSDLERSARFYDALLSPLGWRRHLDPNGGVGWGIARPYLFITEGDVAPNFGMVSFSAPGLAAVKAAWESGVNNGGQSVTAPAGGGGQGPYSAVVADPDGHQIELLVATD
jgi:catechol 2,3-dioxygenase-like lactoylglutathione lyase family enzyme